MNGKKITYTLITTFLIICSYFLYSTNILLKHLSSLGWITLNWTMSQKIILSDCRPITFTNNNEKTDYMNNQFTYQDDGLLIPVYKSPNSYCWAIFTNKQDSSRGKIIYENNNAKNTSLNINGLPSLFLPH